MKIIINTAHQRFGGAVQVALSFIHECRHFPEHEYHVFVGEGLSKSLNKSSFPKNFFFYDFSFGVIGLRTLSRIQKTLRKYEQQIHPNCIISTSGPTYYRSLAPQIIGFNLPLYIYPESPYVKQIAGIKRLKFEVKRFLHYYFFKRDASAYVVQTNDVNQRVRSALGSSKVFTVSNTYSDYYISQEKFTLKLDKEDKHIFRLLTLSAYYPHKNIEIIPNVIEELLAFGVHDFQFVVTLDAASFNKIKKEKFKKYLINVGPVPPAECPGLYHECDAMFLPTLAECFSASYPEAMIMKKPIITTDLGFARSICGDAALYFNPLDAKEAASKIMQCIQSKNVRDSLIQSGVQQLKNFDSAQKRAEKYLALCAKFSSVN